MRIATIALVTAGIMFATGAEAAKFRFGGKRLSEPSTHTSRGVAVIVPGVARAQDRQPAAAPEPDAPRPALRASSDGFQQASARVEPSPWCGGKPVIGGFCILN